MLSTFIYKILHLYKPDAPQEYPSNFGLDRLNRVYPVVNEISIGIKENELYLNYAMNRPYNDTEYIIETTNILLFNITQQNMMFQSCPFEAGSQSIKFVNTNEWKDTDEILFYMALSCESWLGNFNKIAQW